MRKRPAMAYSYSPGSVTAFTTWFRSITAGLGTDRGWFPAFLARDPQGMRAFLSGDDIPPWDVVASLLQDVAQFSGAHSVDNEQARRLHQEAATEFDLRSGRYALVQRLDYLRAARDEAQRHLIVLTNRSQEGTVPDEALWAARDVHRRAMARCAELQRRLAGLDSLVPPKGTPAAITSPEAPVAQPAPETARKRAERLGLLGSLASGPQGVQLQYLLLADNEPEPQAQEDVEDPAAAAIEWQEVHQLAWQLARLRAEGSGGPAHVLLCETVAGPPPRLPRLAQALEQTGQAHEVALLLWEAASLPPALHATAAIAFSDEGRTDDAKMLLRHASARQPGETAAVALALVTAGRSSEAAFLLRAVLQGRPREFAVDLARAQPILVPLLIKEAEIVAGGHQTQLEYILRIEGLTGTSRRKP